MKGFDAFIARLYGYNWLSAGVEMAIIAAIIYMFVRFLRGTRGAKLFYGVTLILVSSFLVLNFVAEPLGWDRLRYLFDRFAFVLVLAIVVVFQPELRRAFMVLGQTPLAKVFMRPTNAVVQEVVAAAEACSAAKIGMIIAIERTDSLSALCDTGVKIDGIVSRTLLLTIFHPGTPLHDMGVVIANRRINAARVQFDQAEPGEVSGELGSRHRAAVGLSKTCDALIVVVSEETGRISVAEDGRLNRGLTPDELRQILRAGLSSTRAEPINAST